MYKHENRPIIAAGLAGCDDTVCGLLKSRMAKAGGLSCYFCMDSCLSDSSWQSHIPPICSSRLNDEESIDKVL